MTERLRIQGGGSPLRVFGTSSVTGLGGQLFDGDRRSLKVWMKSVAALPNNVVAQPQNNSPPATSAFSTVLYGKTFSSFPFASAVAKDSTGLLVGMQYSYTDFSFGQHSGQGHFVNLDYDRAYLCSFQSGVTIYAVIFDHGING